MGKRKSTRKVQDIPKIEEPAVPEVTEEPKTDVVSEEILIAPFTCNDFPTVSVMVDLRVLLAEAPILYGIAPTALEIEEFKQKETEWRRKLKSL